MSNYVKFMRGTPRAYELLTVKDDDTLYFIAEKDADSGRLYLGDREIICDNHEATITYLRDLVDVNLPENPAELIDGQVLTYDVGTESWVARDPAGTAEVRFDSNQFILNDNGELSILNFANAPAGAQLTKATDGSLIWVLPDETTVEGLSEALDLVQADVENLKSKFNDYDTSEEVDTKISAALASANHLSYKIINSVDEINTEADDADRYIYLVKNGDSYDEYMVVNGAIERVGDWNVALDDYATKQEVAAVSSKVEDLTAQLNGVKTDVQTNATSIGTINTKVEDLTTALQTTNSTVEDLASQLNGVKATVDGHTTQITDLTALLNNKVDVDVYNTKMDIIDTDITELKSAMTWSNLSEE